MFFKIFLTLLHILHTNGDTVSSDFMMDFFVGKPYMITAQLCWNFGDISYLLRRNLESNDSKQIAVYQNSTDTLHFLQHLSHDNYFVIDLNNCNQSWRLLDKINNTNEFRFALKFLILINEDAFENQLKHTLANYTIFPSTDMVVAKRMGDTFELYQPYRIDRVANIIWENYGSWNESGLYDKLKNIPFPQRRFNLRGANMTVVLYIEFEDTWNHLEDFKELRTDTTTKQNYGAIKALMEFCNINFTLIGIDNWGYYNETTKQWSGLINIVKSNRAQIGGSSPFYTPSRHGIVDWIKMQNSQDIKFIMKKPPQSYMYNIFTLPFQSNVWKAMGILIILFMIALFVELNWEGKCLQGIDGKERFNVMDITLIMFEAVCQQGSVTESKAVSGRVLTFFMFLSFMFFYCSYSAYIIVILQSTHTLDGYPELISSGMQVGGIQTSYMKIYLSGSNKKIEQELYQKKIGPEGFYTLEDGMAKVQSGFFALHGQIVTMYDYIVRNFNDYEVCNLQMMPGYLEFLKGYTSVPLNSPYKEIFKVGLLKIDEYGIQMRNFLRLFRKPTCYSGSGSFVGVGIIDSYNALLIWACGIGIALIFLILEILLHKRQVMKKETRRNEKRRGGIY